MSIYEHKPLNEPRTTPTRNRKETLKRFKRAKKRYYWLASTNRQRTRLACSPGGPQLNVAEHLVQFHMALGVAMCEAESVSGVSAPKIIICGGEADSDAERSQEYTRDGQSTFHLEKAVQRWDLNPEDEFHVITIGPSLQCRNRTMSILH